MKKSNKHFLSKFEITSFKGLKDVTLEGLGHINLILGDNNVGKTSVLEALLFDESPRVFLTNLRATYFQKLNESDGIDGSYDFITPFIDYKSSNGSIEIRPFFTDKEANNSYSISSKNISALTKAQKAKLEPYFLNSSNLYTAVIKKGTTEYVIAQNSPGLDSESNNYMPFISPKIIYSDDLLRFYSKAIIPSRAKKQRLIQDMSYFIPELEDIEIATQSPNNVAVLVTRIKGIDSALPLNMYGDGSIKFFRILVEIAFCDERRLMIDEIDAGIHFSRLKSLWRTTINSALQNNTQLFITTHNDECLTFLKEVLEEKEFIDMQAACKCYTLKKLPNGSTKAYNYSFEEFSFAINQQIELRGGKNEKH